jgi:hypothetical protein
MATTTTEQIIREAPETEALRLGLVETARAMPMPQLPAFQVAGMSPSQQAAISRGQQGIGSYIPYTTAAGQGYNYAQELLSPEAIDQYMSPYQQQVIDAAMMNINRQNAIQQQNLQSQAIRSGAFGGSREGVQRAVLGRGLAETQQTTLANLLNQGYQNASNRALQSAIATGQIAQGIGSLGQTVQGLGQQDVSFLYGLGQQEQAQRQRELDALRSSNLQNAMLPYQHLSFVSDIQKGLPSSQSALITQNVPSPSVFQQVGGLAMGLGSTFAGYNAMNKASAGIA